MRLLFREKKFTLSGGAAASRLELEGALDRSTVFSFYERMDTIIERGVAALLLDCEKLKYINTMGIAALLKYSDVMNARGGRFLVCNVPPRAQMSMELLGFVPRRPPETPEKEKIKEGKPLLPPLHTQHESLILVFPEAAAALEHLTKNPPKLKRSGTLPAVPARPVSLPELPVVVPPPLPPMPAMPANRSAPPPLPGLEHVPGLVASSSAVHYGQQVSHTAPTQAGFKQRSTSLKRRTNKIERPSGTPAQNDTTQDSPAPEVRLPAAKGSASKPTRIGKWETRTIKWQDLSSDRLLRTVTRQEYQGLSVPNLGGINLAAKIGQGGMGAVYLGFHTRLEREVAVKILPRFLSDEDPQMLERFFREARLAARVESRHLVRVYDVNRDGEIAYIVMECVTGPTGKQFLAQVPNGLAESEALELSIAACRGLAAAHKAGVIHRDVKPDNILIPFGKNGLPRLKDAKLADLGLGRIDTSGASLTPSHTGALGTPGFMAPEQARSISDAGTPADVFSLGACLYTFLTGYPPFVGETPFNVIVATLTEKHQPVKDLRPDLSAKTAKLIERCLMKEPEKRFENASVLLGKLRACLEAL